MIARPTVLKISLSLARTTELKVATAEMRQMCGSSTKIGEPKPNMFTKPMRTPNKRLAPEKLAMISA